MAAIVVLWTNASPETVRIWFSHQMKVYAWVPYKRHIEAEKKAAAAEGRILLIFIINHKLLIGFHDSSSITFIFLSVLICYKKVLVHIIYQGLVRVAAVMTLISLDRISTSNSRSISTIHISNSSSSILVTSNINHWT